MKHLRLNPIVLLTIFAAFPGAFSLSAQEKVSENIEFDKLVHDFGDIIAKEGPVTCTFTMTNTGSTPVAINNVVTSCGCTNVTWTREPIQPGAKGTVSVTYKNSEPPHVFDKTVTTYVSGLRQPVVLRIRGHAIRKTEPLEKQYGIKFGPLGVRAVEIKGGEVIQDHSTTTKFMVANLGDKPMSVTFKNVSPGLEVNLSKSRVEPGGVAWMIMSVNASRSLWGRNWYYAVPVVNGQTYTAVFSEGYTPDTGVTAGKEAVFEEANPKLGPGSDMIGICVTTKENFENLSDAQKAAAAQPVFNESTYNFGKVKAGTPVKAAFSFKNKGKSEFEIYKIDGESSLITPGPVSKVAAGASGTVTVNLDTSGLPKGENLLIVTLTTNSPLRPIVKLFLSGVVE